MKNNIASFEKNTHILDIYYQTKEGKNAYSSYPVSSLSKIEHSCKCNVNLNNNIMILKLLSTTNYMSWPDAKSERYSYISKILFNQHTMICSYGHFAGNFPFKD